MASRELNILVAAKGALAAARDVGKVDAAVSRVGATARKVGKGVAIGIGAGVAVGAAIVGRAVSSGLENLALLEDATTQVTGALKATNQAGKVTAAQVATWANEIETSIQAAFDDKDITSATATLIRFGKVTPANLRPAMVVMTDLAAKTGSVQSASTLLAKALADPTKAAGALKRAGVVLTKQQQDQIKAMVKAGKTAQAQAYLLDLLSKSTKGAAAASAGPYRDSLNILKDVTEDAQKALATGFLPVITKVRDILSKQLAKPGTLKALENFGKGLAGGLDKLIDVATGLPWGSIGDAFKLMGTGSKALLDAFLKLPPWVQTAVITGWGLNKITGGALSGVVGELGKGLIKGVLGMNAGVVNIKAATVTGVGGGVGGTPTTGGGGGAVALIPAALVATAIVSAAVPIGQAFAAALPAEWKGPGGLGKTESQLASEHNAAARAAETAHADATRQIGSMYRTKDDLTAAALKQVQATDRAKDAIETARIRIASATTAAGYVAKSGGTAAALAIQRKRMSVTTHVTVPITSRVTVSGRDVVLNQYRMSRVGTAQVPF